MVLYIRLVVLKRRLDRAAIDIQTSDDCGKLGAMQDLSFCAVETATILCLYTGRSCGRCRLPCKHRRGGETSLSVSSHSHSSDFPDCGTATDPLNYILLNHECYRCADVMSDCILIPSRCM
jgi:hypothetical protein